MKYHTFKVFIFLLIDILLISFSTAQAPDGINYQGKLFEDGGPVDGETRDFRFRLFTDVNGDGDFDEAGDTLAWTDGDTTSVNINDGLFSVVLDNIASYLGYDSLYLAVFVRELDTDPWTSLGSERLWSAPYALTGDNWGTQVIISDSPLSGDGTSSSHLTIFQASASTDGYLSSADWSTLTARFHRLPHRRLCQVLEEQLPIFR